MSTNAPGRAEVTETGNVVLRGSQGLRALAHPARAHAVDKLTDGAQLTATELSKQAGVSASAMSYHLRQLAKWGIVRRVESSDDGRERRWEAAGTSLTVLPESASGFSASMLHTVLGRYVDKLLAALSRVSRQDAAPTEHGTINYSVVWLTDEERQVLLDAMKAAMDLAGGSERTLDDRPPDSRRYEMWTFLLEARQSSTNASR